MNSTLRLFKALPVANKVTGVFDAELARRTLMSGFIFAPEVTAQYPDSAQLVKMVDYLYGRNPELLNQSFHKSWAKVRTAPIQQLVVEQLTHYLTTYGFETFGIYDQSLVYVPVEQFDVPALADDIQVVVIRGYTKDELNVKLLDLLSTGIALHEDTVADVLDVAAFVGIQEGDLSRVANKEVRAALYDHLGLVPSNPTEFLRFAIYRITGETLLIKNGALVAKIKAAQSLPLVRYFEAYQKICGLERLAQVFYRFKPLFLAMRTNTRMRQIINQIRRLAVANHAAMPSDFLNDVTATLTHGKMVDGVDLAVALSAASTFRKIRLAYALQFRTTNADSILYRIRNGKSFAKDFKFEHQLLASQAYGQVLSSIVSDVAKNVSGKTVYIPNGVLYALPSSEKQFSGNIPAGTCVEIEGDGMVAGIHWENQDHNRIDLDLSLQSVDGKLGWDAYYRSSGRDVLFSGDITDAPAPYGASEFFALDGFARGTWLMMVNYYNFSSRIDVPFQILVAAESPRQMRANYTIDPNRLLAQATSTMDVHQKVIGVIVCDDDSCRFYFSESDLGTGNSSRGTKYSEQARDFLVNRFKNAISLNDILVWAGAILVAEPHGADIDLSLETIDKTSIIALLREA